MAALFTTHGISLDCRKSASFLCIAPYVAPSYSLSTMANAFPLRFPSGRIDLNSKVCSISQRKVLGKGVYSSTRTISFLTYGCEDRGRVVEGSGELPRLSRLVRLLQLHQLLQEDKVRTGDVVLLKDLSLERCKERKKDRASFSDRMNGRTTLTVQARHVDRIQSITVWNRMGWKRDEHRCV